MLELPNFAYIKTSTIYFDLRNKILLMKSESETMTS